MSTARAGMRSDPPVVKVEPAPKKDLKISAEDVLKIIESQTNYSELQKTYISVWNDERYRAHAPGELHAEEFLKQIKPNPGTTIIDWGSGTGRGARKLYEDGPDLDVTMVDFAFNAMDPEVKELTKNNDRFRFIEKDITEPSGLQSEYGFCTDVLEHLREEDIPKALANILYSSKKCFFVISTSHDIFSDVMELDDDLHLCVHDYHWWLKQFADQCVVVNHSQDLHGAVLFYVTGWGTNALNWEGGYVNTEVDKVKENMTSNAKLGIQPIKPYGGDGETEVMLLCGGPSLNDFEDEIKEKRANGVKCITVNGSYNWCLEREIKPSLQCMIDARPFMLRMVEQVPGLTDETKYAIASQCDPSIFEAVPHDRTYMWQVSMSEDLIPHIKKEFGTIYEDWFPSPGGSTVGLRALVLLRMLGFNKIYVYGMDSCVFEKETHHAYEQPENDYLVEQGTIPIVIGEGTKYEKTFQCQPWQAFQAREFELMTAPALEDTHIQFKGDGLIAYLVEANHRMLEESA